MELPVFLFDEFFINVRINLRGADVGVTQQFLQNAQVHTRFQAVGGETVPEGVGRYLLGQVGRVLLHDFPGPHATHWLSTRI